MSTSTARLRLVKPAGNESQAVSVINNDFDLIDKFAGFILVNAGITPADADLFDGAIVKEKTTGIVWVAQWNGTSYDKKYIVYPWRCTLKSSTTQTVGTPSRAMTIALLNNNTVVNGVNSASAPFSIGGGTQYGISVPINRIYKIRAIVQWGTGSAAIGTKDQRATTIWTSVGAAFQGLGWEQIVEYPRAMSADRGEVRSEGEMTMAAGDYIRVGCWQDSGASRDIGTVQLDMALISPT